MKELRVGEQRYKAATAVLSGGRTVTEVVRDWGVCRMPEGECRPAQCRQRLRHPSEGRVAAVLGGQAAGQDGSPSYDGVIGKKNADGPHGLQTPLLFPGRQVAHQDSDQPDPEQ